MLKKILQHPKTYGLDIDASETTELRRDIIQQKLFLKKIYEEWYSILLKSIPQALSYPVLELGAGGGFFKQFVAQHVHPTPSVIASDVLPLSNLDIVLDGCSLPFSNNSLSGIVMTNVFHHIPDCEHFLCEAARCLVPCGSIAMIEPWNTPWARQIYTRLHSEPFEPRGTWKLSEFAGGALSKANGALPWIIFERDLELFSKKNEQFSKPELTPFMPFSYLLSGGVSLRTLLPGFLYNSVRYCEALLPQKMFAMFAHIVLQKKDK